MKSLWLAFRPDTTHNPNIWSHMVVPIYLTSDFKAIQSLLTLMSNYKKVAAINADLQADRITLVKIAELIGFDVIELDEQLIRATLTVAEYNELKTKTSLKIGITSCPDPALSFVLDKDGVLDFICITAYTEKYVDALQYVVDKVHPIPVIGVINIADPAFNSSMISTWIKTAYKKCDGLWVWGWQTGNPLWQSIAQENYAIIEPILIKYIQLNHNI